MHSEIDYIHIEIKKGAVASFTKTPTAETLAMVRKLVERCEEKVNKNFDKPVVSGSSSNDYPKMIYNDGKRDIEVEVCNEYKDGWCRVKNASGFWDVKKDKLRVA